MVRRWSGLGPYYAMFPVDFAFGVVEQYSQPGDTVLDPFSGRGTSLFASSVTGRNALGVEINPVGWVYSMTKLNSANQQNVLSRLETIGRLSASTPELQAEADSLPEFFASCFSPKVLSFLLTCRTELNWRNSIVDRTLMAIILVYLHGKTGSALSNQMRQGKAMSPGYSVRWWSERGMTPPDIDPVTFIRQRILWRYLHGRNKDPESKVILGDACSVLSRLRAANEERASLLFTSPPYCGITNYHYDQWLRLWMLGDGPLPAGKGGQSRGKFDSQTQYRELLRKVFTRSAKLLTPDAVVYVRTDARPFTLECTIETLTTAFPGKSITQIDRPLLKQSQTALFGDKSQKPGEVDLILT